ncbi:MFS transporter [Natroniella sp. ANB-PHB2]|uniref:MFS transporter n=1 Tax=Natroniella sp. ANB-PHB2 TaxID=3384444 RepID=UPI0038D40AE6
MKTEISTTTESNPHIKFLFSLSTVYIAVNVNIQGFLSLMPLIREDFLLNRSQVGLYSSFLFLTATAMALLSGRIVDQIGSKRSLTYAPILMGSFIILHSIVPRFSFLLLLALFAGFTFSIITPSLNKAVIDRVEEKKRAFSMGIVHSGGGVGGFIGASLLPVLALNLGWRKTIFFAGFLLVLIGFYMAKTYQEQQIEGEDSNLESEDISFKDSLLTLFKMKKLMGLAILGVAFGTALGTIPAHYTLYLTQDLTLDITKAGVALGIVQIGGIVGLSFWGWINDKLMDGERKKGMILLGVVLAGMIFLFNFYLNYTQPSFLLILVTSFLLGTTSLGWMGIHFTTIAELVSSEFIGIATGLGLVFTRLGMLLSPPLFGYLADLTDSYYYSWLAMGMVILISTFIFAWYER